jgi:hypothetical protein
MGAVARAELEALLKARKLDRTLARAQEAGQGSVPTGIAVLDDVLAGGLPRGEMSEVVGPRSSGRSSLFAASLAASTAHGELAALVDTLDMFDPASGAAAGIHMDRLLWIRGDALSRHPAPPARARFQPAGRHPVRVERLAAPDPWMRVLDRSVKAANLVLQAGGFDIVVLDIGEVPPEAIRRLPFTTWFRLQRTIESSRTAFLLVAPMPLARSAGGVTVVLSRPGRMTGQWSGTPEGTRLFLGLDVEARVVRSRDAGEDRCGIRLSAGTGGRHKARSEK